MRRPGVNRQHSAPVLSASAMKQASDDIANERTGNNPADISNQKLMRVEPPEPNIKVLFGKLEPNLFASFSTASGDDHSESYSSVNSSVNGELSNMFSIGVSVQDKRREFASQKSATSILDFDSSNSQQDWYRRSCPNLANDPTSMAQKGSLLEQLKSDDNEVDDEPLDAFSRPTMTNEWHHSQPDLLFQTNLDAPMASSRPNLLLNRMMKNRSQSVRHLSSVTSSLESFGAQKHKDYVDRTDNHEDMILSPIGDGDAEGLMKKLQSIGEGADVETEDVFDPIPF